MHLRFLVILFTLSVVSPASAMISKLGLECAINSGIANGKVGSVIHGGSHSFFGVVKDTYAANQACNLFNRELPLKRNEIVPIKHRQHSCNDGYKSHICRIAMD